MKRVVVTGAKGLIGWHAHARLHAANCAASFNGTPQPYDIVSLDHAQFDSDAELIAAVDGAEAVLHFAGINRAPDDVVENGNPEIARRLLECCNKANSEPHIVYANSTHSLNDTPYGRGKRNAGEIFAASGLRFTNLILPHIFGEGARPDYNNVTATLIKSILSGETPKVNPEGRVALLHAGAAAQITIDSVSKERTGDIEPVARPISVPDLLEKLQNFHALYTSNIYPDLSDSFDLELFNSYRAATYPNEWPRALKLNVDVRGTLFEAVKGGGGGQTFLSFTEPGVTRGDHFHLNKVERFLVLQGDAIIRVRKILTDEVWDYRVSGETPAPVDMPTLHTHSIENIGTGPLLTLFWTHEIFDPEYPDTYADKVQ